MTSRTLIKIGIGVMIVAIGTWFGVRGWRDAVVERQRSRAAEAVQELVAEQRWLEARGAVRNFWRTYGADVAREEQARWREYDVLTSERTGDLARLVWLESEFPDLVHSREETCLMIVRSFAAAGQSEEADRLREVWRGREEHPHWWFYWEVDQHLAAGGPEEARLMLESREFVGEADAGRHVRLAFLAGTPGDAWAALQEAVERNPRDPDVRSFRGQLLERIGAPDQARVEYVAALVAAPDDVVRRDQLAHFYRRQSNGRLALQTWRDGLTEAAPDFLWLRVLCWERLWGGEAAPLPAAPVGAWSDLIGALRALPPDRFWQEGMIDDPVSRRRAAQRPEVELLKALEEVRVGRLHEAMELFSELSAEARALHPVAVAAVRAVLRWRLLELEPDFGFLPPAVPGTVEHTLFQQLRDWPAAGLLPETADVLAGPNMGTALMLAAGWPQAAMMMPRSADFAAAVPDWLPYGVAVALNQQAGSEAALTYLKSQPVRPTLRLLMAEITWGDRPADALAQLRSLRQEPGDVGFRASWLLAMAAINQGQPEEAVRLVEAHPQLREARSGRELLARAALARGDEARVNAIYEELGPESLDAGLWLARTAFVGGDWPRARALTLELIDRFPAQVELRRNLDRIDEAEGAATVGR